MFLFPNFSFEFGSQKSHLILILIYLKVQFLLDLFNHFGGF